MLRLSLWHSEDGSTGLSSEARETQYPHSAAQDGAPLASFV